jgi:RNA polymerase sigma-70 factor (ECF subfamily)
VTWPTKSRKLESLTDADGFTRFTEAIGPQAYRVAFRWTQNKHTSEDLVQEALLRAWRFRNKMSGNPKAWFFKILWNAFIDYQSHWHDRQYDDIDSENVSIATKEEYTKIEMAIDIEAMLRRLSDIDRYLIALRYGEDFSLHDMSAITGMPVGTIKSRLHRALKSIRH